MINAKEMAKRLANVPLDSIVFVGYVAGRPVGPQGIKEAAIAIEEGFNLTQYTGQFRGIREARNGDLILTVWVQERGVGSPGAYRAFNPSLGTLRTLEVLELAPPQVQQTT